MRTNLAPLSPAPPPPVSPPSRRAQQVLDLVCEGLSNRQIAHRLGLSPRTVECHRSNAFARIGATSTAQAVNIVRLAEVARLKVEVEDLRARLAKALGDQW